jgi:hypothetical protein
MLVFDSRVASTTTDADQPRARRASLACHLPSAAFLLKCRLCVMEQAATHTLAALN